jgi:hypothetical protein
MKPSFVDSQADITQAGPVARRCLAPGQAGKVLAAFSKAIYLVTNDSELFWIAVDDAPMHRRCARISDALPGPSPETPFRIVGHHLLIDSGFNFNIDNTSLWSASYIDSKHVLQIQELPTRINSLFLNLDLSQAKGFGKLIPHILSLSQNESHFLSSADPILVYAQPFVLNIARACQERNTSLISQNADRLIGLGSGLTPSGDDFVGGMLFSIKILQSAYPELVSMSGFFPIEVYRSKTHLISFTLLGDLANGHAIEPLHQIINGLLSGKAIESIYPFILQLTQVGNSTGWDMLAGFLTGLLATYQNNCCITSNEPKR